MKVLSNTAQLTKGAIDWTVSSFKIFEITAFHTAVYELHAVIKERASHFSKQTICKLKMQPIHKVSMEFYTGPRPLPVNLIPLILGFRCL